MRGRGSVNMVWRMWLVLAVLATLTGCGFQSDTLPVSGVVTYQGKPVEGAQVALAPSGTEIAAGAVLDRDSEPVAKPARGMTDAEGKFTVKTYFNPKVNAPGARPGEYTVTVTKFLPPEGMTLFEWDQAQQQPNPNTPPLRWVVPEKFSKARESGLSATVKKGEKNHFKLDLVD